MFNFLICGGMRPGKKTLLSLFNSILKEQQQRKEWALRIQIAFLEHHTYLYFCKEILKARHESNIIDLPDLFYLSKFTFCPEAQRLTDIAIKNLIRKGPKHIERCYKAKLKELHQENK